MIYACKVVENKHVWTYESARAICQLFSIVYVFGIEPLTDMRLSLSSLPLQFISHSEFLDNLQKT